MSELPEKYQTNSDPYLYGIPSHQNSYKFKKSPNCPLMKGPYIKIKVESKNLEMLLKSTSINETNYNSSLNFSTSNELVRRDLFAKAPEFSINPFIKIQLNQQSFKSEPIHHNNPKWLNSYELEINNYKIDKLYFEIYNLVKKEKNIFNNHENEQLINQEFLGFQMLPIKYLEKNNLNGNEYDVILRLIDKKPDEYFVTDDNHALNINNHDPSNYKIEETIANDNNSKSNIFTLKF